MPASHSQHIATQPVDTAHVASDSTALHDSVPAFVPKFPQGIPATYGNDSVITHFADLPVMEVPAGENPASYRHGPLHDTGSMSLLLFSLFLIVVSYKTGYKYMENFATNLFSIRRRGNVFDDHTVSDLRILIALIFNTCLMEGLLGFYAIGYTMPGIREGMVNNVFLYVGIFTALAGAFYLAQLGLYNVLGYVFGRRDDTAIWLSGYKASQSVLGLLLFPVTVILLVYPTTIQITLTIALILYIFARIVFIWKGFRIFFGKITQIVYFILYLCSVEIVPPVLISVGAIYLCSIIQS